MATPFLSEIRMFAFDYATRGWALCNGQLIAIAQNSALFALVGTVYGGNGVTTFALPNLQGRVPVHFGQGSGLTNRTLGETYGEEGHTLTTNEIPSHTHVPQATPNDATSPSPVGTVWAKQPDGYFPFTSQAARPCARACLRMPGKISPILICNPIWC